MEYIKVIGTEVGLNTTPSAFGNNRVLRVFNNTAGTVSITRKNAGNTFQYSMSVLANTIIVVSKGPTDTFEANAAILAAPVAFTQ